MTSVELIYTSIRVKYKSTIASVFQIGFFFFRGEIYIVIMTSINQVAKAEEKTGTNIILVTMIAQLLPK